MLKRLQPIRQCTSIYANLKNNVAIPYFKNEQSFNDHISSLCKQKLFKDALRGFDILEQNEDYIIYPSTYAHLISACASLMSLEYGKRIHDHILKFNLQPDVILENHILNMYGKCGSMKDARKVFDNMQDRNVVTWTALIAGYSLNGPDTEAINLYILMQQLGQIPDHFTFGSVFKACSSVKDIDFAGQLHAQVVKSEFGSHLITQNALITMYAKFGQINIARDVFSRIKSKDLISWSSMIAGFSKFDYEWDALICFKDMLIWGTYHPNEFIFGSVFSACGFLGQPEYGRQVHGVSVKYGFAGDSFTGCSLTNMYAKCGFLSSAKTAFDLIKVPDTVSWNAMIAGFANCGDANEAMLIFSEMRRLGLKPDDITVRSLLCAFADTFALSQGIQVHSCIIKMGLNLEISVCNTLLTMYANCSSCDDSYKMFEEIRSNADLVSWNAIITVSMHHRQVEEVISLFKMMLLLYGKCDHITLANVLGACRKVTFLEMGGQVHCYAVKTGLSFDNLVMNTLIDLFMKCGSVEIGRKLFDFMENIDVVSWSSLIVGYAQFGYSEEALKLFKEMKNLGVKPNEVTLVGVLTACSHVGLVEEGLQLFKSMEKEHGVVPTREHYSCIVDLLARGGRIHDAEDLIDKMPFKPDIVTWKTLLAACKTRNNLEVGKRVAENILKIDPSNSAAHVLLCSLYASSGDWEDFATSRSLMKEKGVKKIPGQSWIEVKDRLHAFLAYDGIHPEREKIYSILNELWSHILNDGCIPTWEYSLLLGYAQ